MGPHLVLIFLERSFFIIIMLFDLKSSKQEFDNTCTVQSAWPLNICFPLVELGGVSSPTPSRMYFSRSTVKIIPYSMALNIYKHVFPCIMSRKEGQGYVNSNLFQIPHKQVILCHSDVFQKSCSPPKIYQTQWVPLERNLYCIFNVGPVQRA